MKMSTVSIFSCLLMTSLLSTQVNAQTKDSIEKLVEKNVVEACNCVKDIEYIDNFVDFDMKFDHCIQSKGNRLLKKEEAYQKYNDLMYKRVESCGNFAKTVDDFLKRPEPKLSDAIYNNQEPYKDIAKNIVGQYSMSFGNYSPEGGTTLALLDNQRYVIVSFGTVIVGDWRIVKGKYLHLLPYRTESPFYVFGRHNTKSKNKTTVTFDGGGFGYDTLIHFDALSQERPILTPVFNDDANCFKSPYKAELTGTYHAISLAFNPDYENKGDEAIDMYTFNNDKNFNEFYVLEFNRLARREVMKAMIDNDELVFEQGRTKRSPLPEASTEDAAFFRQMSDIKPFPKTLNYNLAGREVDSESINREDYTFDSSLNAYIANTKCSEDCPTEDDYDYVDIFYEYQSLEDIAVTQSKFKISEQPAIYTVCEEYALAKRLE